MPPLNYISHIIIIPPALLFPQTFTSYWLSSPIEIGVGMCQKKEGGGVKIKSTPPLPLSRYMWLRECMDKWNNRKKIKNEGKCMMEWV